MNDAATEKSIKAATSDIAAIFTRFFESYSSGSQQLRQPDLFDHSILDETEERYLVISPLDGSEQVTIILPAWGKR